MRVIVCGGRDYTGDAAWNCVMDTLTRIHAETPITAVIEGGAPGADRLGRYWAQMRGIKVVTVPALWSEHGRAAGPIRNTRMVREFAPDLVVAFPGGRGTADMIRQADAFAVPVRRVTDSQRRSPTMCMADSGDAPSHYVFGFRRARKAHKCEECGREIQPGETYRHHFGVMYRNETYSGKTCAHCVVLMEWLQKNCDGFLHSAVLEDAEEHVGEYHRMDLARLVVAARHQWKSVRRGTPLPVPALPRPIRLGDARP